MRCRGVFSRSVANHCHFVLTSKNKCLSVQAQSPYDCPTVTIAGDGWPLRTQPTSRRQTPQMLDTRTNEWLSRLQANTPKLVSLLFAALILLLVLQIGYSYISKPLKSPQPVVTTAVPRPQRTAVHVQKD